MLAHAKRRHDDGDMTDTDASFADVDADLLAAQAAEMRAYMERDVAEQAEMRANMERDEAEQAEMRGDMERDVAEQIVLWKGRLNPALLKHLPRVPYTFVDATYDGTNWVTFYIW